MITNYPIKGMGEFSYKWDSRKSMKMKDVLYVPGLNEDLLSISYLDKKGFRVAFVMEKFSCGQKVKL